MKTKLFPPFPTDSTFNSIDAGSRFAFTDHRAKALVAQLNIVLIGVISFTGAPILIMSAPFDHAMKMVYF